MSRKFFSTTTILIIASLSLLSFSCSKQEKAAEQQPSPAPSADQPAQEQEIPEETVTETEDLSPVEAPTYDEAFVTYSSGTVDYRSPDEDGWLPIEIGQSLRKEDSLRVADGAYCELQFGESAVVKVKEATTLTLSQVSLKEGERNVKMKMQAGAVLNRVEKLAKGERFKVQTPSAVCGVRGTQFSVENTKDNETKVAVKEGSVSVQPGSVDTDELKDKVKGKNEELEKAIEQIGQTASVISSNQEIDIDNEVAEEADETSAKVTKAVEEIAENEEEAPSQEQIDEISKLAEEVSTKVAEKRVAPKEISKEKSEELREIDDMKLLNFEPVQKTEPEEAEADEEEAGEVSETAERPMVLDLHKVAVRVEPKNARIRLNGKDRGRGSFSGVFNGGAELSFEISREGFKPHSFDITVEEETAKLYRLRLAKKEKEKPVTENFEIRTVPEDAEILKNGEKVAEGSYAESFEIGEKVAFTVHKEGYKERELQLDVALGSGKTYKIDLDRKTEKVNISAEPADSEIIVNGETVASGSFSDEFPVGKKIEVAIRKEGYKTETLDLTVGEEVQTYSVSLQREQQRVVVETRPGDAKILINGRGEGTGSASRTFPSGRELTITARREGYESRTVSYRTGSQGSKRFSLDLEPLPLQFTADISDAGLIGNAVSTGDLVFTSDKKGRIFAVSRDGEKRWTVETDNGRNENSYPVVSGNTLFFTGSNEMVKVRADKGTVISRTELSGDSAHLFGRRVVPYEDSILMPTNGSIRIIDQSSGELQKEIPVPGGSRMTPAIWNGKIITVNQQGSLLIIDPESSSVEGEISTAGMQPVALAPVVRENRAVFSGRKGTVVCVDLAERSVNWERDLSGESVSVFSDPECSPDGVYLFAGSRIFGLSMKDGSDLFAPISGVTSPPLYRNGTIIFGTSEGGLSAADAATGERHIAVNADEVITTRPVPSGRSVAAGTEDGTVLIMSP